MADLILPTDKIAEICQRYHVLRLSLFGSALRGELRSDSDIDVLVEFESGAVIGFKIGALENELTALLGRRVDLSTPAGLSRYFRQDVLETARPICP